MQHVLDMPARHLAYFIALNEIKKANVEINQEQEPEDTSIAAEVAEALNG